MTIDSPEPSSLRLGRSAFWLHFVPEDFGLTTSWRLSLIQKSPRPKKGHIDAAILDISPRKPLLTIILGGETFPLFVSSWEKKRGGKITLHGERRVSAGGVQTVSWSASLVAKPVGHRAHLGFDVTVKMTPRTKSASELRIHLPIQLTDPYIADSEVAAIRGEKACVAWDAFAKKAVSFVAPPACRLEHNYNADGFRAVVPASDFGARKTVSFSARFGTALRGPDCKSALLLHYADVASLSLPTAIQSAPMMRHDAAQAVARLSDKGSYDVIGMDRAYPNPPCPPEAEQGIMRHYYAGYPYFPVDATRAMMDWSKFVKDEPLVRVAKVCARGIAADFPHLVEGEDQGGNKSAFWDRASLTPGKKKPDFHAFDGQAKFSLITNARLARAMLDMSDRAGEHIFEHTGLNAVRWLLLRQNHPGYFGGDRCDLDGAFEGGPNLMAGAEAIPAFVGAFRASDNEVYIKAAWRIARYIMEENVPPSPRTFIVAR